MEEFKKKGYYPAGGRSSSTSAANITYNNSSSGIDATNVQDAIDAVAQGGGGGGGESNVTVIHCPFDGVNVECTVDVSFSEVVANAKKGNLTVMIVNYAEQALIPIVSVPIQGDFSIENPTPEDIEIQFNWDGMGATGTYTDEYTVTWEA